MVVVQRRRLRQILVREQQAISLQAGLLQEMAPKYNILLVKLIDLAKVIKHYTLYGSAVYQMLLIQALQSLLQLNVLDLAISC